MTEPGGDAAAVLIAELFASAARDLAVCGSQSGLRMSRDGYLVNDRVFEEGGRSSASALDEGGTLRAARTEHKARG
jgi:hypothetical protein